MDLFTLAVNLSMDTSVFNRQAQSVMNTLSTLGSKLGTNTSSASGTSLASRTIMIGNLASMAIQKVADAVVKLGKSGVKYNAEVERYQSSFSALLGSEEKAVEMMDKLRTFAESTSFDLPGSAQIADRFLSAGFAAEEALDLMARLGDVAGSDMDKFSGLALVFEQMKGLGKMYMNDLRQMTSRSFNPLLTLAEETGLTMAEINTIVQENPVAHIDIPESVIEKIAAAREEVELLGDAASAQAKSLALFGDELDLDNYGIAFETVYRMLKVATDEGGQFYGRLEKEAQTVTGQTERLKESFSAFMGQLSKPISDVLSEKVLPSTNALVDSLAEAHEQGGFRGLLSTLTTTGAQGLEDGVNGAIGAFNKLFETDVEEIPWLSEATVSALGNLSLLLTDAASAAQLLVQSVVSFMEEHPFIVDAIGAMGAAFLAVKNPLVLAAAAVGLIATNWDDVKTAAGNAWLATKDFLGYAYNNTIGPIIEKLSGWFANLWANIVGVGDAIAELFGIELDPSITGGTPYDPVPPTVSGGLGDYSQGWGDDYITGGGPISDYFERNLSGEPEGYRPSWNDLTPGITTGDEVYGPVRQGVTVVQNIYSQEQSAADLMQEARWQYEQLRLGGMLND